MCVWFKINRTFRSVSWHKLKQHMCDRVSFCIERADQHDVVVLIETSTSTPWYKVAEEYTACTGRAFVLSVCDRRLNPWKSIGDGLDLSVLYQSQ